jgi:hypothetical protein
MRQYTKEFMCEEVQLSTPCMVLVALLYLYCQVGTVTKIWLGRSYTRTGLLQKIIIKL